LLDERAALMKAARTKATAEVGQAKNRVAADLDAAKRDIEVTASQLATEIASKALHVGPGPMREA